MPGLRDDGSLMEAARGERPDQTLIRNRHAAFAALRSHGMEIVVEAEGQHSPRHCNKHHTEDQSSPRRQPDALHHGQQPKRRQQKEGMHITLKIMRGASEQRTEHQEDEARDGHIQDQPLPIHLACPLKRERVPDRECGLAHHAREQRQQNHIERKQKSQRREQRKPEANQGRLEAVFRRQWRDGLSIDGNEILVARDDPIDRGDATMMEAAPLSRMRQLKIV